MSKQDLQNLGQSKPSGAVTRTVNTVEHTSSDTFAEAALCTDSRVHKQAKHPTHPAAKHMEA